ncbi:hypothetical protein C8R43DRAFT_964444 [Mycena crocata]|nr:hypothetical protein C8R43DRAFT_964444 [Mycena crocata]
MTQNFDGRSNISETRGVVNLSSRLGSLTRFEKFVSVCLRRAERGLLTSVNCIVSRWCFAPQECKLNPGSGNNASIQMFLRRPGKVSLKRVVVCRFLAQLRNFPASFDHCFKTFRACNVLKQPTLSIPGEVVVFACKAQVETQEVCLRLRAKIVIPGDLRGKFARLGSANRQHRELEPEITVYSAILQQIIQSISTCFAVCIRTPGAVQGQCMMTKQHYKAQDWAGDGDDGQDDNGGTKHCVKQLLGASPVYPGHSMVFSGDGRPVVAKFGAFGFSSCRLLVVIGNATPNSNSDVGSSDETATPKH